MCLLIAKRHALGASAAVAILAGCSGAGSPAPQVQIPSASSLRARTSVASRLGLRSLAHPLSGSGYYDRKAARSGHVFVSDATADVVDVFTGMQQTGQITGFQMPQGITTDRSSILYVANTNASNVEEFTPPYDHKPAAIITDGSGFPVDVAVSGTGVVAVLNICSGPSCSLPGNVTFYAKGSRTLPCAVVYGGDAATPLGGAFDDTGTLFIGALNSGRVPQISEVRGGCKARTIAPLTTSNSIFFPGDVEVDRSDNIAVLDSQAIGVAQIDIYAPPPKHSRMLKLLSQAPLNDAVVPLQFALTADGQNLWTADPGAGQAQEYAYPAGGPSTIRLNDTNGGPDGVAVTPAESP
jgi:hypothetical protein